MSRPCRACGKTDMKLVLALGDQPPANALLKPEQEKGREKRWPLDLFFCPDCTLVQVGDAPPPEDIFQDYPYFSSYSETMLAHAKTLAETLIAERGLNKKSVVVELASNDGYLLQFYQAAGVRVLGVEPAANIAKLAVEQKNIQTFVEFFDEGFAKAQTVYHGSAAVIHANNVLAHVPDPGGFLRGIGLWLAPGGTAVIEAPRVGELVRRLEFDTIYHEHLCYFSLSALVPLFRRSGLELWRVEEIPIHGGSYRLYAGLPGQNRPDGSVEKLLDLEKAQGLDRLQTYLDFARRCETLWRELRDLLHHLKLDGARLAAYGAAAKGATLLNTLGVGRETLDYVVDRSPYKQGKLMPGSHLAVFPTEKLEADPPDYVLLLTWNFAEEIMAQQEAVRRRGVQFILPVPEPKIL